MAGWKTQDMLSGIDGIMNLAAASGEDLAKTSDIVTDALTGFGLSAADSSHFADVLAAASSNANTNVGMLGESFKYVSPLCGAMSYSAEDTAIALGLMANSGIKAGQAGTALRGAISSMLKPSENAANAMERYGISLIDSSGNAKSLKDVMGNLRTAFGQMSEAEKTQAAATIFGTEAMSGMLAIINASEEDYNKLTDSIYNCDGSAKQMADTMQNNLQGKVTQFKSALEGAGIAIGENLLPALTKIVEKATGVVQGFGELDSSTQSMIVNFGLVAVAAGPVISFIGKLTTGIGSLISGISAAASGVGGLGTVIGAVFSPAGLIAGAVVGVAALTAGFVVLQNELDANGQKLQSAASSIDDFTGRVRTNRSLWTEIFGEEIEIKFTDNFDQEKEKITQGYQDLITAHQNYLNDRANLEQGEAERRLIDLTADFEEQKTLLNNHLDSNLQSLTDYFMNEMGLTSQQTAEQQQLYIEYYHAQEQKFDENQKRILEIQRAAADQKRELTSTEQEEINRLTEENGAIMASLTTATTDDMLSAWKLYYENQKVLMEADKEQKDLYAQDVSSAYNKLTQNIHKEYAKQEEDVRNNASLNKEQQDIIISNLHKREDAETSFTEMYGRMVQENVMAGNELADANGKAFGEIVKNLQNGSINSEEFGMTNEQYMAMAIDAMIAAGASSDELTAAIERIPKDVRAEVLAQVKGKDKVDNLKSSIDGIKSKTVTITAVMNGNVTQNAPGGGKWTLATGTENANSGLTEVAEYGPELIVSRSGASAYLATDRQLINMEGGERVFNARQTSEILNRMQNYSSNDDSDLLKTLILKVDTTNKILQEKEFNKITENMIHQVDVNGVTDIKDITDQITRYIDKRTI